MFILHRSLILQENNMGTIVNYDKKQEEVSHSYPEKGA